MRLEHVAFNVKHMQAVVAWYVEHLGMQVARADASPPYATFVTDSTGRSMLEFYTQTRFAPPDWGARDRMQTHLAFLTGDLDADRDRLVAAGAAVEGDPVTHPNGDRLLFMRDPWGLAFQLVRRAAPLLDT